MLALSSTGLLMCYYAVTKFLVNKEVILPSDHALIELSIQNANDGDVDPLR